MLANTRKTFLQSIMASRLVNKLVTSQWAGPGFWPALFTGRTLHSSLRPCLPPAYATAIVQLSSREGVMSGSTPPPPLSESVGSEGCFPPGYKHFKPEEHGLERGFRLTAFSDLKGWGCKVPQEALLKLLAGLEADRADGTGKAEEEASDFGQQLSGPRLGKKLNQNPYSSSRVCQLCQKPRGVTSVS